MCIRRLLELLSLCVIVMYLKSFKVNVRVLYKMQLWFNQVQHILPRITARVTTTIVSERFFLLLRSPPVRQMRQAIVGTQHTPKLHTYTIPNLPLYYKTNWTNTNFLLLHYSIPYDKLYCPIIHNQLAVINERSVMLT